MNESYMYTHVYSCRLCCKRVSNSVSLLSAMPGQSAAVRRVSSRLLFYGPRNTRLEEVSNVYTV